MRSSAALLVLALTLGLRPPVEGQDSAAAPRQESVDFFEKRVRPALHEHWIGGRGRRPPAGSRPLLPKARPPRPPRTPERPPTPRRAGGPPSAAEAVLGEDG